MKSKVAPSPETDESIIAAEAAYQAKYGNLDEIAHPSLVGTAPFCALLRGAVQTGTPLTQEAIEAGLGHAVSWDW